jgi:hypothetical protein
VSSNFKGIFPSDHDCTPILEEYFIPKIIHEKQITCNLELNCRKKIEEQFLFLKKKLLYPYLKIIY